MYVQNTEIIWPIPITPEYSPHANKIKLGFSKKMWKKNQFEIPVHKNEGNFLYIFIIL